MKLEIQLFGGRGASSGSTFKKTYTKGDLRFKVSKNEKGLYSYQSQERVNGKWTNMSKQSNFTRTALEDWLDIRIKF